MYWEICFFNASVASTRESPPIFTGPISGALTKPSGVTMICRTVSSGCSYTVMSNWSPGVILYGEVSGV